MDDWLIYHSPTLKRMVVMNAAHYDRWARGVGPRTREEFPVIARGLTHEQAKTMVELTKENQDGNEI